MCSEVQGQTLKRPLIETRRTYNRTFTLCFILQTHLRLGDTTMLHIECSQVEYNAKEILFSVDRAPLYRWFVYISELYQYMWTPEY